MNIQEIAAAAHEVNRNYCLALGDTSQPEWDAASDWQKSSVVNGVKFHLANPTALASASHESWSEEKQSSGWKYGAVKDAEKKEHPCFIPFEELPTEQKAKDYIFRGVIHALKLHLNSNDTV